MRKLGLGNAVLGMLVAALVSACSGGTGSLSGDGGNSSGGTSSGGTSSGGDGTPVYRVGILSGSSFQNGVVAVGIGELAAGGQTSVAVDIVDATGARALGVPASVNFFSECAATGKSTFASSSVSTSTSHAETTYLAQGCQGLDKITVVATVGTQSLTATGSVTVQSPDLGSIGFVSATPTIIGMAGGPITQQSIVIFKVIAKGGGALSGQTVSFVKSAGSPAGVTLSPSSAVSDGDGLVRVTVKSGSAHGVVRITASTGTGANVIKTDSDQLVITTGFPHDRAMSLATEKLSVDSKCDGEPVLMPIRLADRYANPVAQGTAVTFTTTGGKIAGQCTTGDPFADPTTEGGVCTVLLTVQNPRPSSGIARVTASTQGEESFYDGNKNGYFDGAAADLCVGDNPAGSTDCYWDANSNGKFDGYVCESPGVNCSSTNIELNETIDIVFSDSDAKITSLAVAPATGDTFAAGRLTFTKEKNIADVLVLVKDGNGNTLPSGTTYTMTSGVGTVLAPVTVGPFSNPTTVGDTVRFRLQAPTGTTVTTGVADLVVTVPATNCREELTITLPLFAVDYSPPPASP